MAGDLCNFLHGLKPAVVMVLVQIVFAGLNLLFKLAIMDGMNMRILVAYRYIFATIFLAPLAFFLERKNRPKLTWMVTFQAFLCGFFGGTLSQNLYLSSLTLTSLTYITAMTNLIPAITYIMAVTFRLERLGFQTLAGKAKLMGTAIGIGGAMVLTFYKGVEINIWSTKVNLTRGFGSRAFMSASHKESDNIIWGSLLALGFCFSYVLWLVIQTKMSKRYPCNLSSIALMCSMGSIQSTIYALCVERNWDEWKLGWNIRLWSVTYAGILASGVVFTMIAWGLRARGPLFVSVFSPLLLMLVAFMGSLILNEKLHVGSIVGSVLIVVGLYVVLLGKGKEMKKMSQLMPSKSTKEGEQLEVVVTTTTPYSSPDTIDTFTNNNPNNIDFSSNFPHNLATVAPDVSPTAEEEKEGGKWWCHL